MAVTSISAGAFHSIFLKNDGTVYSVGLNNSGQLGNGSIIQKNNPVLVVDAEGNAFDGVVDVIGRSCSHCLSQKAMEQSGQLEQTEMDNLVMASCLMRVIPDRSLTQMAVL